MCNNFGIKLPTTESRLINCSLTIIQYILQNTEGSIEQCINRK